MKQTLFIAVAMLSAWLFAPSSLGEESSVWTEFLEQAQDQFGDEGAEAARFLANNRPERDEQIGLDLLIENLDYALRAKQAFPWAKTLDGDLFMNDVLPYAIVDETREAWRASMHERASSIVNEAETATEAAQALNRELFNTINVHYNTGRKKPNQSIGESIEQGRATCTGLSIILVNACRSVGIPARLAGVANWHDGRGNHTWVEIWDGKNWRFTGADEYNKNGLDLAWFTADASKATAGDPVFGVWATSWKKTGHQFTMSWNDQDRSVHAVDVTHRYASDSQIAANESTHATRLIRVRSTNAGERLIAQLELINAEGTLTAEGTTRAGHTDLNDMPEFTLKPREPYLLRVTFEDETRLFPIRANEADRQTLDLDWSKLGLTKESAERAIYEVAARRAKELAEETANEIENQELVLNGFSLRYKERVYGEAPADGRSLWISLHGGGSAPPEVNNQQWENQIRLYELEEGIYIAPRAPTNDWNLWHQGHIDELFARLIESRVATGEVNPERVYLLGYSAGGDGVYQLAPRMADRFAAAAMMAGHPNGAAIEGVRNLPFAIYMGAEDAAYDRNTVAKDYGDRLKKLHKGDPAGYTHIVQIYEGLGHWMEGRDKEAVPWLASFKRNTWPDSVVWHQDDVTHTRFYWLGVDQQEAKQGNVITARADGQAIHVETDDVARFRLLLRDQLIDLDRPITVFWNNEPVFRGYVARQRKLIEHTLTERYDPAAAATAKIEIRRE